MKTRILITIMAAAARSLLAADSDKADVTAATKKLSGENYTWKSTADFGNFSSTTKGKTDKEGQMTLSITAGDNTREAVLQKGGKGAIKSPEEGWQSLSELENASGGGGRGRQFLLRRLQNFKAPADEAADLLAKVKDLTKEGDAYSGELNEDGAKDLLTRGRRRGREAPEAKNAKASVKFWVKDGQLTKYELKQQGTVTIGGNERDVDGTTTVEISDVGTTKVEIPDDAKKKLS